MKSIFAFVKKEFILDFKQAFSMASIFTYLISILFAVSLLFKNKHTVVSYSSIYWIIFVFTTIISSYRNLLKENDDSNLFNYIVYSPIVFIAGKIIYSVLLNMVLGFLLLLLFILLNGNLIQNVFLFAIDVIGLSIGLGALLSLTGSISSRTDGNFALMSIMSFPLVLPLLIIAAKLSISAIEGLPFSMNIKYLVSLFSLDIIIVILSLVLFPQAWTE